MKSHQRPSSLAVVYLRDNKSELTTNALEPFCLQSTTQTVYSVYRASCATQADADPARDAELVSPPSPTIRALTRVSRNVRAEVANIYWSRTKFHYSTHNLLRNKVHGDDCGHYRLRSWLSTSGKLAVTLVRRLDLTLSFYSGGLDMQLRDHTRPSIDVWIGNGFGAEENLKAYVTAALFPDDRPTMTTESLGMQSSLRGREHCLQHTRLFPGEWLRRPRGANGAEEGRYGRVAQQGQVSSPGYDAMMIRD